MYPFIGSVLNLCPSDQGLGHENSVNDMIERFLKPLMIGMVKHWATKRVSFIILEGRYGYWNIDLVVNFTEATLRM